MQYVRPQRQDYVMGFQLNQPRNRHAHCRAWRSANRRCRFDEAGGAAHQQQRRRRLPLPFNLVENTYQHAKMAIPRREEIWREPARGCKNSAPNLTVKILQQAGVPVQAALSSRRGKFSQEGKTNRRSRGRSEGETRLGGEVMPRG